MSVVLLICVLLLILAAEFVNGWNDACNAIATVVSTRVLSPMTAVLMAVLLNIAGAMSGTAVATTVGKDILKPEAVSLVVVTASVFSVFVWGALASYGGLPISITHALMGGLVGAGLATSGFHALLWAGWQKILIGLVLSTVFGFVGGYVLILIILRIFHRFTPRQVRGVFGRLQILSAAFMAFSHGSNDGQKFIGVFTMTLFSTGVLQGVFHVPWWVILLCSVVMGLGTSIGGWRIIRTMGTKLVRMEPHHGFAAETGAATIIEVASRLGIPLSTTHTISTAIMGVGASRRFSAVRWGVAGEVVVAWLVTFPVCMAMSWISAMVLNFLRVFLPAT